MGDKWVKRLIAFVFTIVPLVWVAAMVATFFDPTFSVHPTIQAAMTIVMTAMGTIIVRMIKGNPPND